jgi:hypothetical protein
MKNRVFRKLALLCGSIAVSMIPQVYAAPVISELYYDASGSDSGLVFVELFGVPGQSLDGLVLEGVNGSDGSVYQTVTLSGVIPQDGVFVVGDDSGGSTFVANADLIADVDFQNGPDSVVLINDATILDAVGYGDFATGDVFAGEGAPAPDAGAGSSIARFNAFSDTGDNSVDFIVLETPSPGVIPRVSAVPLPGAAWLFVSGLISLCAPRCLRRIRPVAPGARLLA